MDIVRHNRARARWWRRGLLAIVVLVLVSVTTVVLSGLKRAAPVVDADTVWVATVKRGEMLREVHGNGTLVPKEVWWIPAPGEGRVERVPLDPGETVTADTVLVELSNPVLERDLLDAEWQLHAAEAGLRQLKADLRGRQLDLEEAMAVVDGNRHVAKLQVERDRRLFDEGLLAQHELDVSSAQLGAFETRTRLMGERLEEMQQTVEAQLAVQQAKVEQFRALEALRRQQLDALDVKAGTSGVLQQLMVEVGQQVTLATTLAKVARPDELEAELRIQETQMQDVQVGQQARIDTRNGIIDGRVARIDPSVVAGTVTVAVTLEGPLPKGARPDLSVAGTIEIERLADVLYVGRPVGSQSDTRVTLFKLDAADGAAVRTPVQLGRGSVNAIEVLEGLEVGDRIVASDMSKWEMVDRIRLK